MGEKTCPIGGGGVRSGRAMRAKKVIKGTMVQSRGADCEGKALTGGGTNLYSEGLSRDAFHKDFWGGRGRSLW